MNIEQAKQEVIHTVQAYLSKNEQGDYVIPVIRQRPILLMGAPGIGKTQIMEQIARECEIGLVSYTITHHTRQSAVGLPMIKEKTYQGKEYTVTEYTMSEIIGSIYEQMEETGLKEGILFIDEINCVSETLAPMMLQFLQCKTFGNQTVPDGWIIVTAGNPPEYNKSVKEFDMVTLDRLRVIHAEPDYEAWKVYAHKKHLHPVLLSYLDLKPQHFYLVETQVDGLRYVTARGWEDLSNLMEVYESLDLDVTEEIIFEFLHHEDVAEDVAAYIDLMDKYKDTYGITDILSGAVKPALYQRIMEAAFDERVSVIHLMLDALDVHFREYHKLKKKADDWYGFLKEYRAKVEEASDKKQCYLSLVEERETRLQNKKNAGLLLPVEVHAQEEMLNDLKNALSAVDSTDWSKDISPKDAFMQVKTPFDAHLS
ncbi:MAG: AAA family ATPase, partial [Lachnospiraceae bacterium]|nr:AAA family ATPase [Lachnospiraceae bacterium]